MLWLNLKAEHIKYIRSEKMSFFLVQYKQFMFIFLKARFQVTRMLSTHTLRTDLLLGQVNNLYLLISSAFFVTDLQKHYWSTCSYLSRSNCARFTDQKIQFGVAL